MKSDLDHIRLHTVLPPIHLSGWYDLIVEHKYTIHLEWLLVVIEKKLISDLSNYLVRRDLLTRCVAVSPNRTRLLHSVSRKIGVNKSREPP